MSATMRFTEEHEWLRLEGEEGVVGITEFAQNSLGDMVFVELPEIGRTVAKGEEIGVLESVKAASEIYAPVSGTITMVNGELGDSPGLVNESAEDRGWLFRLRLSDPAECDSLLDTDAYRERTAG